MSNRPSMATHQSIETLHRSGHSNRRIARLLSIDRGAVNKRVRQIRAESQAEKEPDSGADQIPNGQTRPPGLRLPNSRRGTSKERTSADRKVSAVSTSKRSSRKVCLPFGFIRI